MLESEIKKLTAAIEALTKAMAIAPVTEAPVEAPVAEAPVEEAPIAWLEAMDKDTLTRMCLDLSRAGHKDSIKAKLESYGVKRVTELVGSDNYGKFCDWVFWKSGEIQ
tara:strand:- start:5323 stop:5646 length:324 start_codon:yes stop_codon:yes gene_type:complete